jgi:hypothetical protein
MFSSTGSTIAGRSYPFNGGRVTGKQPVLDLRGIRVSQVNEGQPTLHRLRGSAVTGNRQRKSIRAPFQPPGEKILRWA